jgi:hypothetical protein
MTNEVGRPPWATMDPCFRTYFNTEWGMPVHDAFASLRPQSSRQQPAAAPSAGGRAGRRSNFHHAARFGTTIWRPTTRSK